MDLQKQLYTRNGIQEFSILNVNNSYFFIFFRKKQIEIQTRLESFVLK